MFLLRRRRRSRPLHLPQNASDIFSSSSSSSSFSLSKPFQQLKNEEKEFEESFKQEKKFDEEDRWSNLIPEELLEDIIKRIVSSEKTWPLLKNVVSCACVSKRWRRITKSLVPSPFQCGIITFPSSLKQPGPRDFPLQCVIRRDKKNSMFYLYLGIAQSFTEKGKFLLSARRFRHGTRSEYVISLDANDLLSQGRDATYVGKLSSNFLGTKFTIYDNGSSDSDRSSDRSLSQSSRRLSSKKVSPQVSTRNFEIGRVSYEFNLIRSRGPRRMLCTMQYPRSRETNKDEFEKPKMQMTEIDKMVLRNKAPRWHRHLQCWCLNFHGRVTVASVKNFQLVATVDPSKEGGKGDNETVLLQFGKVEDDLFTMDYRQPLSAFQAFAICLTSFGTKIACE